MERELMMEDCNPVVLVTGASGFLGRRVVQMLAEKDVTVRALVRRTSRIDGLSLPGVEIVCGDIADADSLRAAFSGVDYVVHAAADTSGTEDGAKRVTIGGTKNVLELCAANNIRKLVYISSCSVYGTASCLPGQELGENDNLEPYPERRGIYSWAKFEAERLVIEWMRQVRITAVCLRPATIYGIGGENLTPMIGFAFGKKLVVVIDQKGFFLPLVYVDNLVAAIYATLCSDRGNGQTYNVADPYLVDKKYYLEALIRKMYPGLRSVFVPYQLILAIAGFQEKICNFFRLKPFITAYRLETSQKQVTYSAKKITEDLEWQPLFTFDKAVERIIHH